MRSLNLGSVLEALVISSLNLSMDRKQFRADPGVSDSVGLQV